MNKAFLLFACLCLGSFFAQAQTAYIPNSDDGTYSVIDVNTATVTATIQVAPDSTSCLRTIWATDDGKEIWIADDIGDAIFIFNTADNMAVDTIPAGEAPVILVAPGGDKAYISNFGDSTVMVVDGINHVITDTIIVGGEPGLPAITPDGSELYVPIGDFDQVIVIDLASHMVTDTFPVGVEPEILEINPAGTELYVANFQDTVVTVIDIVNKTITDTIQSGLGQAGIAFTPDGSTAYVANIFGATVSVINTSTKTVVDTIDVGDNPSGVNVTPDGNQVYAVNQGSDNVMVIDVASNAVVDTIEVGGGPVAAGHFISIFPKVLSIDEEITAGANIKLYPNPVSAELTISLELIRQESLSYRVHNTLGQVLTSGNLIIGQDELNLDVHNMEAGMYFLSIEGTGWTQTASFVKQ
ncbi:MAG: T9SS type A sorting domain-containing protein [Bacteroidota bacterium]